MIDLNLLPLEQKEHLRYQARSRFIIKNSLIFLIIILIVIMCLGLIIFFQRDYLEKLATELEIKSQSSEAQELSRLEKDIKKINNQTKNLKTIFSHQSIWSGILEEIGLLVPEGVELTGISFDSEKNKITVAGKAATREAMLRFEENLKTSSSFKDINSPLSNLLVRYNASFSFDFSLEEGRLFRY